MSGKIFGTDGVRDIAGQGALAPESVARLAAAIGSIMTRRPKVFRDRRTIPHLDPPPSRADRRRIVIGRDTRDSGLNIEEALARGLRSFGIEAWRVGVVPTPAIAWLTRAWAATAGIIVSASHNPPEYNGIKLVSSLGLKLPDAAERAIEEVYREPPDPPDHRTPTRALERQAREDYARYLLKSFPSKFRLKLVVDCGNGSGAATAPAILRKMGTRPILIHSEPNGSNINVRCGATHPDSLIRAVRAEKAHAGVAFDGDQDRAILVDECGRIVDGDAVLAIVTEHLLREGKLAKNTVVGTVMSNWGLEQLLRERGVTLRRAAVGDRYVADAMMETGAILGGEQSGHVIFFDVMPTGDGLVTVLKVLDIMVKTGEPLSRLASPLKRCPQILLNVPVQRKPDFPPKVRAAIARAEGRLNGQGRVLVRYSGTENLCRVMVEGFDNKTIQRIAHDLATTVKSVLS